MTATTPVATAATASRPAMLTKTSAMTFVLLLGTVSLFGDATYQGGRSLVGQYLQLLGASAFMVGLAVGAGEFLGYALRLITGYAADKTGAYWRITLVGYGINLIAVPALAFAGSWEVAVGLVLLERIGKAIRNPARDAMLSYATKEMGRGWGYGIHGAMDQLGGFLGPALMGIALLARGATQDVGDLVVYQDVFKLLLIPAICALALLGTARFLFPHPRDLESKTPKVSPVGLTRRYWLYVLASGCIGAGFSHFALIAFHLKRTAIVSDEIIPMLYAVGIAVTAVTALVGGRLYDRKSFSTLILTFGLGALFAPFIFLGDLPVVVAGLILWGVGMAAQESILRAALADVIPMHRRAYGFGMFAFAFGLAAFIGGATMGFLYDLNVAYLVIFSVAIQLLSMPLFLLAKRAPVPQTE